MANSKIVKFYYFKVLWSTRENFSSVDLSNLFNDIQRKYSEEDHRFVYEYQGEKAKFAYINLPYEDNDFYQLTFERLRDFNYPVRTKLVGDSKDLGLSNDEYLGEEVTVLYDHQNDIMMIQNNRNSLSYKAIELCLNALLLESVVENEAREEVEITNEDGNIKLSLVTERNPMGRVRGFIGMKEVVLKTNILSTNLSGGHIADLYDAIRGETEEQDAENLEIEIKITAKNLPSSNKYISTAVVEEVLSYDHDGGVKKLVVKGVDIDNRVDEVNLIENKLSDKHPFSYDQDRQLSRHAVYSAMEVIYKESGQLKVTSNF